MIQCMIIQESFKIFDKNIVLFAFFFFFLAFSLLFTKSIEFFFSIFLISLILPESFISLKSNSSPSKLLAFSNSC